MQRPRLLFALALLFAVSALAQRVQTPPPNKPPLTPVDIAKLPAGTDSLEVYLLMGQSNMKGRGVMPEEPLRDPRIVMMHLKTDGWFLARHPLHLVGSPVDFEGHDNAGVGPGLAFAQAIEPKLDRVRIALIPCAVGGTPISRWAAEECSPAAAANRDRRACATPILR